jgi:hypothetical protein
VPNSQAGVADRLPQVRSGRFSQALSTHRFWNAKDHHRGSRSLTAEAVTT